MLDKSILLWYNKGTKRERYKIMTAIDFIKQHPHITKWTIRGWAFGEWQDATLLDVITEKYGTKCYVAFVSEESGEGQVWIER